MKKFCIFLFLLFSLSSCFSRKTNYYMLDYKDNPNKKEISCEIPSNFIIQVGPVEILENGKYGIIVDNSDEAIVDIMRKILKEKDIVAMLRYLFLLAGWIDII